MTPRCTLTPLLVAALSITLPSKASSQGRIGELALTLGTPKPEVLSTIRRYYRADSSLLFGDDTWDVLRNASGDSVHIGHVRFEGGRLAEIERYWFPARDSRYAFGVMVLDILMGLDTAATATCTVAQSVSQDIAYHRTAAFNCAGHRIEFAEWRGPTGTIAVVVRDIWGYARPRPPSRR